MPEIRGLGGRPNYRLIEDHDTQYKSPKYTLEFHMGFKLTSKIAADNLRKLLNGGINDFKEAKEAIKLMRDNEVIPDEDEKGVEAFEKWVDALYRLE